MSLTRAATRTLVIALTNRERRRHGVRPLKASQPLTRVAQNHADDMAARRYFDHDTKGGPSWDQRLRRARPSGAIGENIAFGQIYAAQVVRDWMNSPPHRRNILDPDFTLIGIGLNSKRRWVQDFGGPG
jgi:uncharacterized protein YkwD